MNYYKAYLMLISFSVIIYNTSAQQNPPFFSEIGKTLSFSEKLDSIATIKLSSLGEEWFEMFLYDASGRIVVQKSYAGTNSNSDIISQDQFYYHAGGMIDSVIIFSGYSGSWNSKTVQINFFSGNQMDSTVQTMIPNLNKPAEYEATATSYRYTAWGGLTQLVTYSKADNNAPWIPQQMQINVFDSLHRKTYDSLYYFQNSSATWVLSRYNYYANDFNTGLLMEKTTFRYSGGSFLPDWWENYSYNSLGYLIRKEAYNYDMDMNMNYTWLRFMAFIYMYDGYGNLTEETWYNGAEYAPYWFPSSKSRMVYDVGLAANTALPAFSSGSNVFNYNRPSEILTLDTTLSGKVMRSKSLYYYSGGIGIAEIPARGTLFVYPNPAISSIQIYLPETFTGIRKVQMITPGGSCKEVPYSILSKNSLLANLNMFSGGVYILVVSDSDGNHYLEKIIKME
jgi:hypothetical protein